jgi:hypothetical protein
LNKEAEGISLLEINKSSFKKGENILNGQEEDNSEILRIEKLEKMINSLNGSVNDMNNELKMLKNSIYRNRRTRNRSDIDLSKDIIKSDNSEKMENSEKPTEKSSEKSSEKSQQKNGTKNNQNLLKMKTFNDLSLDLNSLKAQKAENDTNNDDEFLQNLFQGQNRKPTKDKDDKAKQQILDMINNLKKAGN